MSERHSVIIAMLNGAKHVGAAIDSVRAQLDRNDEILVVDNGSTDGSPELVSQYGDTRVRLLSEPKRGPAAARNRALREATGSYISFVDHDDLWPPARHRGLMQALAAEPDANAAYGRIVMLFETPPEPRLAMHDGKHVPSLSLHPYVFRRELIDRTGLFDEDLIYGEDMDYLVRLRSAGLRSAIYDGGSYVYRRHGANLTFDYRELNRSLLQVLARQIARKRTPHAPGI